MIYTGTISYYVLMRNIKYINMTWGLTRAIKAMDDAKQPIISVHYFLKALTWVRSLYTFNGSVMLGYKKDKTNNNTLLDLPAAQCIIRCSDLNNTNEDLKTPQGHIQQSRTALSNAFA